MDLGFAPPAPHRSEVTGVEESILLGGKKKDSLGWNDRHELVPADLREKGAKVLGRPPEASKVLSHRTEDGGISEERTHIHVRDEGRREIEPRFEACERRRKGATK
jgi:hypothetical protein